MASVREQLGNLAPPSGDGGDAMQEDYEGDAEVEAAEAAALEAKHAEENAATQQMAAAPLAAQAAVGGFVTHKENNYTVRRYNDSVPQDYAEFHADGKRYLVGWKPDEKNFCIAFDENTKAPIGKLDINTGAITFDDTREPATVSLSATQAAKPREIQSAVKVQQAIEKRDKTAVKTEVKAERDAEIAGLDVQKAELEYENANIDKKKTAAVLHEEALVRLFPQSLAV
jgi:hypothetical protein